MISSLPGDWDQLSDFQSKQGKTLDDEACQHEIRVERKFKQGEMIREGRAECREQSSMRCSRRLPIR